MRRFNSSFQVALKKTVEEMEENSGIEVVVAVAPRSGNYIHANLWFAALCSFVTFTLLMFLPQEFSTVFIYAGTINAFLVGFLWMAAVVPFKRIFFSGKTLRDNCETRARAYFQRAGIHKTRDHTGILFYFSFFERVAIVLPDDGARQMVPPNLWEAIRQHCDGVFQASDPSEALLGALREAIPAFDEYVVRREDDVNELPDELRVMP